SWWGQYHHICYENDNKKWVSCDRRKLRKGLHTSIDEIEINNWNIIPQDFRFNLFLLILADHLASSVSRAVGGRGSKPPQEGIFKLWNKGYYKLQEKKGRSWAAFKTIDDLKILFNEIENCRSGDGFLSKYRDYLLLTPEDKSIPRNVTSLYTHAELVGKIYRVLEKNTRVITEPDGSISIDYNGERVKKIKEAEGDNFIYFKDKKGKEHRGEKKGKSQARLVKCRIKFPHSFVRLQDINLLRKREELVNCIAGYYKDEVIFATSDFITLFLPPNQDLKEILKPLLDWGFYIEVEETLADLGILNSILDRKTLRARESNEQPRLNILGNRDTKVYRKYLMPETPDELQPPICDICQQRRGVERIKETIRDIREWICEKCQEIRNMGEPFREYATVWEEEGVKVCWFKFSLDQKKLEDWLQNVFEEYVDNNFRQADILKDEFRSLALQVDFNKDYKEMLKEFWKELAGVEDIKKPIAEYDELGVLKYSPELTKMIIEKFLDIFEQYFPDCASDKRAPLSLSLSIASIKYPIRDHWRFFEENSKNFLNVRYHKVFGDAYTKDELENILEKAINVEASSSFLHKLVQLEESLQSEIHIAVEIFNNKKKYPEIYELFSKGIKPSKFLNLYKLFGGGSNEIT
ncbi:MAG: hypothetical protein J7K36_05015, partial [Archaeoglobaceae archaeon]|nr:hypothetical protein [Archaeoglobaceae archaeon]